MRTSRLSCVGLLLLTCITSCTSVKRFRSAEYKGEDNTLVDMELFGASLEQSGPDQTGRNLWDLSASAQTRLIQILNERYPGNGQFTGALNQEYMLDGPGSIVDLTDNKLRMVFTISRKKDYSVMGEGGSRFSPADRIETVKFSLAIPEEYNLSFTGWNRYLTEYGEIEIADMSFSRSMELSGDFSSEYAEAGIKSSSGRREDQAVRSRYLKLNGSISAKQIRMEAEGTREIDLAGNVLADVSLTFEGFPERITLPVYGADGVDFPHLSGLNFVDVYVPRLRDLPDPLMATLTMEYIYRHVESGWKSFQEWDDRVAYYSGRVSKEIQLLKKEDYLPQLYCLGSETEGEEAIKIRSSSGVMYPLQFIGYQEAGRFLEWLLNFGQGPGEQAQGQAQGQGQGQSQQIEAGSYTLMWDGEVLTSQMLTSLVKLKVVPVF